MCNLSGGNMTERHGRVMDKDMIMSLLKDSMPEIRERFSVDDMWLFGSFIRGDEKKRSDIDILVTFRSESFKNYMELRFFLSELYGKKIDLIMMDALKPRLKEHILKEAVLVA